MTLQERAEEVTDQVVESLGKVFYIPKRSFKAIAIYNIILAALTSACEQQKEELGITEPDVSAGNPPKQKGAPLAYVPQRSATDCLRCCIAMTTRLPYESVPDFIADSGESWPQTCEDWLEARGMGLLMFRGELRYMPPWLPLLVLGKNSEGNNHFVVYGPDRIYDPANKDAVSGVKEIIERYAIVTRPGPACEEVKKEEGK